MTAGRVTVDVGNSSVGVGTWRNGRVAVQRVADPVRAAALIEGESALISVAPGRLEALLSALDPDTARAARVLDAPPGKLGAPRLLASAGADRVANMLAARPGPSIVVDAGTAVTVDVMDGRGVYLGGFIAAGPATLAAALARSAAQLPPTAGRPCPLRLGEATEAALSAGVWGQAVGGVDQLVASARAALGPVRDVRLLATGGWGAAWARASSHAGIECDADLVHRGIARWAGWR